MAKIVALAGNPNTGKSTVFNGLTGLRQRTGNYPGVTVEKKVGHLELAGETIEILDLPGTYSLDAASPDERVVIEVLSGLLPGQPRPDLVVVVLDASNLRRNLFLASQIAECGLPMILALNQWDIAVRHHLRIDVDALKERFGVDAVPMNAKQGRGIEELRGLIAANLREPRHMARMEWPASVREATAGVRAAVERDRQVDVGEFVAHRLLFDNSPRLAADLGWEPDHAKTALGEARRLLQKDGLNPTNAEAVLRYQRLGDALNQIALKSEDEPPHGSESIDEVLCHRWLGLGVFFAIMFFAFQSVYSWAAPLMDAIESVFGWLGGIINPLLEGAPMLQSLVVDGIIGGVGGVVVFLPQIFILFLFIGLLEDSGYMARAAFLMDKLFSWCGLNGKCFIPLLSSYACAIPGILSTRTIEDPKARLATILVAPLMSCSARLPVYVLFIAAFVQPQYGEFVAGLTLFLMHFVGLAVAAPLVWLLNRFVLKTPPQPFLIEMPRYRVPRLRDLILRMWLQGREFLVNAGTIILAFTIIIWALLYFPHPESLAGEVETAFVEEVATAEGVTPEAIRAELAVADSELAMALDNRVSGAYLEQSLLGRFGKTVQPIFAPAGFDWKLTVGVLASFPAREVIISTLGVIYNLGEDVDEEAPSLRQKLENATWTQGPRAGEPVYTLPVALSLMVFFALCMQCGATVATIARATSWGWAAFSFFGNTIVAWLAAVAVYQIGMALS